MLTKPTDWIKGMRWLYWQSWYLSVKPYLLLSLFSVNWAVHRYCTFSSIPWVLAPEFLLGLQCYLQQVWTFPWKYSKLSNIGWRRIKSTAWHIGKESRLLSQVAWFWIWLGHPLNVWPQANYLSLLCLFSHLPCEALPEHPTSCPNHPSFSFTLFYFPPLLLLPPGTYVFVYLFVYSLTPSTGTEGSWVLELVLFTQYI